MLALLARTDAVTSKHDRYLDEVERHKRDAGSDSSSGTENQGA
jgi:hypothetical protein